MSRQESQPQETVHIDHHFRNLATLLLNQCILPLKIILLQEALVRFQRPQRATDAVCRSHIASRKPDVASGALYLNLEGSKLSYC